MLRDGLVTKEQLEDVLRAQHDSPQQRISGWRLGELLTERGLVTQGQVAQLVAEQYELPFLELEESKIDQSVSRLLPPEMCERYSALPIESLPDGTLLLAVSDPATVLFSDELRRTLGRPLRFVVVSPDAMDAVLGKTPPDVPTLTAVEPGAWPSSAVSFGLADGRAQTESDVHALAVEEPASQDATSNGAPFAAAQTSSPLGTLLVRDGLVTEDELEASLAEQRLSTGKRLGEILVERGSVTRVDIARVVAEQYELPFVDLSEFDLDPRVSGLLPLDIAERFAALPLDFLPDGSLRVAVADPTKVLDPEEILAALGARLSFAVADPDAVESAIARQQPFESSTATTWPSLVSIGPPVTDTGQRTTDASDLIVGLAEEPNAEKEPDEEWSETVAEKEPEAHADEETAMATLQHVEYEGRSSAGLVVADAPEGSLEADDVENVVETAAFLETVAEPLDLGERVETEVAPSAEAFAAGEIEVETASATPTRRRGWLARLRGRGNDSETHAEIGAASIPESDPIAGLLVAGEASADPELAGGTLDDERERRSSEQASVLRLWMSPEPSLADETLSAEAPKLENDELHVDEVVVDEPATDSMVAEAFDDVLDLSDEPSLELDEGETAVVANESEPGWDESFEGVVEYDTPMTIESDAHEASALAPSEPETPAEEPWSESMAVEDEVAETGLSVETGPLEEPEREPVPAAETADAPSESSVDIFRHEAWISSWTADEAEAKALASEQEHEQDFDALATEAMEEAADPVDPALDRSPPESEPVYDTQPAFEADPAPDTPLESDTLEDTSYLAWVAEPEHAVEPGVLTALEPALAGEGEIEIEHVESELVEEPRGLAAMDEISHDHTDDKETPWMFLQPEAHSFDPEPSFHEPELVSDQRDGAEDVGDGSLSAPEAVVATSAPEAPAGFEAHEIVDVDPPAETAVGAVVEPVTVLAVVPEAHSAPDAALAAIVERATALGATTLHFSAQEHGIVVRARVDGVLRKLDTVTGSARFALALELTSAAHSGTLAGGQVTALPTPHGETVAVRFRPSESAATLEGLSLDLADREAFERALRQPFGLVLVTGPAGSGQAGTLAAALHELTSADRAVMTIEDPILHVVPGADQVAVDHTAGRGFADGLRQLLEADPDVIIVGDLPDEETTRLALDAAASNLVVSSVVAQSAVGAVDRLEALGVDPDLTASTLTLVVAQRLVRRLCDHCREGYYASAADIVALRRPEDEVGRRLLGRSTGCAECGETGYAGTIGMYEVLVPNDEVRALVAAGAPAAELERAARLAGKRTLADDGVRLCLEGLTTVTEVQRVLGRSL